MRVTIKEMLSILILNMNYYIFLEVWTWTTRAIHLKEMRAYIGYKLLLILLSRKVKDDYCVLTDATIREVHNKTRDLSKLIRKANKCLSSPQLNWKTKAALGCCRKLVCVFLLCLKLQSKMLQEREREYEDKILVSFKLIDSKFMLRYKTLENI